MSNLKFKTMGQLNPKDLTFQWEKPNSVRGGSTAKLPDNFILIKRVKKDVHGTRFNNVYIDFKANVLERYFKKGKPYKVAFSFDKDALIIVFDPKPGVPFYTLAKNGGHAALSNIVLIDKIWKHFKLDEKVKAYYLKIHYLATLNEMEIHVLTPQDYQTRLPIFEDELYDK